MMSFLDEVSFCFEPNVSGIALVTHPEAPRANFRSGDYQCPASVGFNRMLMQCIAILNTPGSHQLASFGSNIPVTTPQNDHPKVPRMVVHCSRIITTQPMMHTNGKYPKVAYPSMQVRTFGIPKFLVPGKHRGFLYQPMLQYSSLRLLSFFALYPRAIN